MVTTDVLYVAVSVVLAGLVMLAVSLLGLIWIGGHELRQMDEDEPKLWTEPGGWPVASSQPKEHSR